MIDDPSAGWEFVADRFAALRSDVGSDVINRWADYLEPGGTVVDVGCGTGVPVATSLVARGFEVYGIDPSPTLLAAFRRHVPGAATACEVAENSRFFDRRFDGAVAIGLIFLLPETSQRLVIDRVGRALNPGGNVLFSVPQRRCRWNDSLTGRSSLSLGEACYRHLLTSAGCRVVDTYIDDGANHYIHAVAAPG